MDISLGPPCSGAHQGHEQTESHIHCQQTCMSALDASGHSAQVFPPVSCTTVCGALQR